MSQVLMNGSLLQIKDLSVTYRKKRGTFRRWQSVIEAVKSVSLHINEAEIIAVVGESGCGKTTLARSIARLIEPTGGSIVYDGVDIASLKGDTLTNYRRGVQMVFQDPYESLNPRQDVFTIISAPLRYLLKEKDPERIQAKVRSLMKEVRLDPDRFMRRLPHQLSGGERQRVSIARALATDPKLLIADEPTSMLDAAQRLGTLRLLDDLRLKRKLAVMVITHDLATAKMVSSRIFVMYLGRVVEMGRTADVLSSPLHPYVELILGSTASLEGSLLQDDEISKEPASTLEDSSRIERGCVFRPRCKYATAKCAEEEPDLVERLKEHRAACHNPLQV